MLPASPIAAPPLLLGPFIHCARHRAGGPITAVARSSTAKRGPTLAAVLASKHEQTKVMLEVIPGTIDCNRLLCKHRPTEANPMFLLFVCRVRALAISKSNACDIERSEFCTMFFSPRPLVRVCVSLAVVEELIIVISHLGLTCHDTGPN